MQATSMEHIGRSGTGGLDPDQRAGHDTVQESLSKTFARNFPVYGRIADGWPLSSDFRPNDELLELRGGWQAAKAWTLDALAPAPEEVEIGRETCGERMCAYAWITWGTVNTKKKRTTEKK